MWLFLKSEFLGSTIPTVDVWRAFVLELLLTFFLMIVIIKVSTGSKEMGTMAEIAIRSVVLLEALFAGPITNASMNPARSLAPNIVSGNIQGLWLYMIAPILGALLAVMSCKLVKDDNCCEEDCKKIMNMNIDTVFRLLVPVVMIALSFYVRRKNQLEGKVFKWWVLLLLGVVLLFFRVNSIFFS